MTIKEIDLQMGDMDKSGNYIIKMMSKEELIDFANKHLDGELIPEGEDDLAGWKYLVEKVNEAYSFGWMCVAVEAI